MPKCVLIGPVPPPYGGMAVYLSRLQQSFACAGVSCEVIGLSSSSGRSAIARHSKRLLSFLSVFLKLSRTEGRVVICFSGSELNLCANGFVVCWAKVLGKKVVLRLSGGKFKDSLRSLNGPNKWWLGTVLRKADRIIAVNQEIGEALKHYTSTEKILMLSNALPVSVGDSPSTRADSTEDPEIVKFTKNRFPLVVCIGGTDAMYGSDLLLHAVARIRQTLQAIGLVLVLKVGASKDASVNVPQLVQSLGMQSSVKVLMDLPRNQVLGLLRRADLFVRPTLYDGDSNAVREALELGIPVLASDAAPRPDGVALFRSGNTESLEHSLLDIMSRLRDGATTADLQALADYEAEGRSNLRQVVQICEELAAG